MSSNSIMIRNLIVLLYVHKFSVEYLIVKTKVTRVHTKNCCNSERLLRNIFVLSDNFRYLKFLLHYNMLIRIEDDFHMISKIEMIF